MKFPRSIKWSFYIGVLFLTLFTLFRFLFYFRFKPADEGFPGGAFWMGFKFDARVAVVAAGLTLLLAAVPALRPWRRPASRRFWVPFLVTLTFAALFLYVVDYYHYDYLQQRLNGASLSLLKETTTSAQMVWETYPVIRVLIALVLLVLLFTYFYKRLFRAAAAEPKPAVRHRWIPYTLYIVLLLAGAWGSLSQFALRWSDVFGFSNAFEGQLALNPFQSLVSTLKFRKSSYDARAVAAHYDRMAPYLGVQRPNRDSLTFERSIAPAPGYSVPKGVNVVLVICESFSAYKSSMWGNPLNATPYFKSLCDSGVFFRNCFTNSYSTARGVWAVLTGLPDVERNGSSSRNIATVDQHILISDFAGYSKYYFIGGSASWANIRGLLNNNIRDLNLVEQDGLEGQQVDVWGISDKNLLLQATRRLTKEPKPFFAVIQTADNHKPYTIPDEDRNDFKVLQLSDDELKRNGFSSNGEYNAFRYTDFCFQKFMEEARRQPWFDNTLFVFVGDHGVSGEVGRLMPKAWTTEQLENFHVPLLFYSPKHLRPEARTTLSSQIDILPSIASLASVPARYSALGKNLFDSSGTQPQRWNSTFVFSPNDGTIGYFEGDLLYRREIDGKMRRLLTLSGAPVPKGNNGLKNHMDDYVLGWWETNRYLLYHNKSR
ncbi:LTA synthase family protein [Flaviaesturariibacter aridisoli]|uniref:LTA synthase family protein n=1 Tax=Flaviaesturariibacter aridisoli TaxID=2545761 RepID=A0A4V2WMR0_9BACT|nr:LTA synthase family protein [Flaviaesturariibacter aridisoli]TCZ72197.1 LTA synthase family protein [Flaviaesturariibacter aridisoli]